MKTTDNFFSAKKTWSTLTDEILSAYLKPYLAKISRTRLPVLIADCFAGKGRFDDGKPGSPVFIASAIKEAISRNSSSDIRGIFIEKKYVHDLEENLKDYSNCKILEGDYETRVQNFLKLIKDPKKNLLLYVDPYGIKPLSFKYFQSISELGLSSFELLMNLNSFGFIREGCRLLKLRNFDCTEDSEVYEQEEANSVERMNAVAYGTYWQGILQEYNDGYKSMAYAEREFTTLYSKTLGTIFRYVVNIPIKQKSWHLPKYRLIFGTNSEDGLLLMADKMSRTWKEFIRHERKGQQVFFEELDFPDSNVIGAFKPEEDIWEILDRPHDLKELLVKLIQKYGIAYSE